MREFETALLEILERGVTAFERIAVALEKESALGGQHKQGLQGYSSTDQLFAWEVAAKLCNDLSSSSEKLLRGLVYLDFSKPNFARGEHELAHALKEIGYPEGIKTGNQLLSLILGGLISRLPGFSNHIVSEIQRVAGRLELT